MSTIAKKILKTITKILLFPLWLARRLDEEMWEQ